MTERQPIAYGYIRPSMGKQGMPLESQVQRIQEYYEARLQKEAQWGGIWSDAATSGKVPLASRPQGSLMGTHVEPGDHIIIARAERAFCSAQDLFSTLGLWSARGIIFHILDMGVDTGTKFGRLLVRVLASFAKFERDSRAESLAKNAL